MATTATVICTKCKQAIDTQEGYLVATEDGLQFTSVPDPQLQYGEEPMHFVCQK